MRANGLQEGDFIVIYSDMKCGKYVRYILNLHIHYNTLNEYLLVYIFDNMADDTRSEGTATRA